ncbi:hypothetical protein [Nonomuraea longicatena]
MRTEVLGFASGVHAGGYYSIFGDPDQAERLRAGFERLGFTAETEPMVSPSQRVLRHFADGPLLWCFLIAVTATVSLVGLGVGLGARAYGTRRALGGSYPAVLAGDLRRVAGFLARAVPVTAAGVLAVLLPHNGLHQIADFAWIAAGLAGALASIAVVTHAAALALVFRPPLPDALRDAGLGVLAVVGAYAVRVPAVMLTFTVAAAAVGSWRVVGDQRAGEGRWAEAGAAVRVMLSGTSVDLANVDAMERAVGNWLRRADGDGRLVLASRRQLRDFLPAVADGGRDVLVVNGAYLTRQQVLLASGRRAGGAAEAQVLIPPDLAKRSSQLAEGVGGWVAYMGGLSRTPVEKVLFHGLRGGQSLFTYGSGPDVVHDHVLRDPVVVVLPASPRFLVDTEYTAYASRGAAIFPEPDDVARARAGGKLGDYVNGVQPVAQRAADQYRSRVVEFRDHLVNLGAAIAVLLITAVGVCAAYAGGNVRQTFARRAGHSLLRTYGPLLVLEAALASAFVTWSLGGVGGDPVAVAITAVGICLVVVALAVLDRRF